MASSISLTFPNLSIHSRVDWAIYEVRLSPSSPCITSAIAGPHHSFNLILEKVGNVATMLAAFTQGITEWKLTGPPPPWHFPLTMEEIKLALSISEAEMIGLKDISDWKNPITFPEEYLEEEGVAAEAEKFSSECPILPELGFLLLSDPARLRIPQQTHATSRLPIVDEKHREPHCISTSRHVIVQQLISNTALTSMSPWTLPPPAHLHQDQLVAGGGERGDPLLLLKGWSVVDLFWFAVAIGVSLYVLNLEQIDTTISKGKSVLHEVDKTLQFSSSSELSAEEVSTTTEIPREGWTLMAVAVESLSSCLTSVTVMRKSDNMAWKPPWISFLNNPQVRLCVKCWICFGLLIAFTQASYQHHDGPHLLERGQELGHCLQAAADEDPRLLHVQVLLADDDQGGVKNTRLGNFCKV